MLFTSGHVLTKLTPIIILIFSYGYMYLYLTTGIQGTLVLNREFVIIPVAYYLEIVIILF